jgi:hypothetical protein
MKERKGQRKIVEEKTERERLHRIEGVRGREKKEREEKEKEREEKEKERK